MYEFTFEGYSKDQCRAYLERIGAEFNGELTIKNLDMLISRHQKSVPFENLALCMNWGKVDLEPDALFKKIVTEKRGGFCHELNGAFLLLLKGLGYDVVSVMARVGLPFLGTLLRLDHRGIIARIDGKQMYIDVGMAGPKADWAVEMASDGEKPPVQTRHGSTFWVEDTDEGWKMLKSEGDGADGSVIIFAPIPMLPEDMYANCYDLVNRKNTMFHTERLVNICRENGYTDLRNNTLTVVTDRKKEIIDFEEEEFNEIISKHFGINRE